MDISTSIRIGTRDSKLALWQAEQVKEGLERQGISCTLVPVKSEGDLDLVTPLYAMGVEGVFTRTLDAYLLSNKIDIAVHSMKDVPVQLAQGIVQAAVLPRASHADVLVAKNEAALQQLQERDAAFTVATGSIRRKAQWLHRYPGHTIESLRGNVQTRLQKLQDNDWQGAIFAAAGLERLGLDMAHRLVLDWMLPAPAQGAVMAVCREGNEEIKAMCSALNDEATACCVKIERDFLAALMGGCSAPISALATIEGNTISFKGNVLSPDGQDYVACEEIFDRTAAEQAGSLAAATIIEQGAAHIIPKLQGKDQSSDQK